MINAINLIWGNCKKGMILILFMFPLKILLPFISLQVFQFILNSIQNKSINNLIWILSGYFLLLVSEKFTNEGFNYILSYIKLKITNDLNIKLINKVINLELCDFENSSTYNKIHESLRDINTPFEAFNILIELIDGLFGLLISCYILVSWDRSSLLFLSIAPLISFYFTIKIGKFEFLKLQERVPIVRKISYLKDLLINAMSSKENKILGVENYFKDIFVKEYDDFLDKDKKTLWFQFINGIIFQFVSVMVAVIIIFKVIDSVISGLILFGTANTLIACIWNVTKYSEKISLNTAKLYTKKNYLKNMEIFLDHNSESLCKSSEDAGIDIKDIDTIEFINVSFKYKENLDYVLKNVSFKIEKGDKVVIVGQNGSGKSTILKLILGIYEKYDGDILINGISLRKINKYRFYEKIGVIFQNFTKYELKIMEFLKLSNLNIQDDDVLKNLNIFESNNLLNFLLEKDIENLQLGNRFENGIDLSGGEWQQLVFCRTLMKKNMSLLVLDEPNSGLDVFSEKKIYKILDEQLTNDVTKILVTHRLHLLDIDDYRIIYIENGVVCEDDTSKVLLSKNTKLKKFYKSSILGL